MTQTIINTEPVLDNEGYLVDMTTWTKETALEIARLDELALTNEHWLIINYLRNFYQQFPTIKTPTMRVLIKELIPLLGTEKANSIYFHQLFSKGLVQACRIAGLPKSTRCNKNVF